jgi:hypothetical protein
MCCIGRAATDNLAVFHCIGRGAAAFGPARQVFAVKNLDLLVGQ